MKILVLSDSHGVTGYIPAAVKASAPDLILHLGDYVKDALEIKRKFPDIPLKFVAGNCDYGSLQPEADEFTVMDKHIFMCHGHTYGVKQSLDAIFNTACLKGADILLFGHTHYPYYDVRDGIVIINPGSIGHPRGAEGKKTYAVLTIENGAVSGGIVRI